MSKRQHKPVHVLPMGALMLATSMHGWAQTADNAGAPRQGTLGTVHVYGKKSVEQAGKDSIQAVESTIGKGKQALRDIPQSVTVVTEKLIDDRNLDTVKEALKQTAGISFLAAEGGEEDIRLRGFALQATGDLFIDGMRDPALYDRDTFNLDRLEVLRGSASMLFGRGSTGGAVNQVTKVPRLMDEHQVDITLGNHAYKRVVGDFNVQTDESSALRINAMVNEANNNGAGSSIDKRGIALAYRQGIGERHEFLASLYHLDNNNGVNYGLPWVTSAADANARELMDVDPSTYYGMSSDYSQSSGSIATLGHTFRADADTEVKTQARWGRFKRDLRASTVRFGNAASQPGGLAVTSSTLSGATVLTRGSPLKLQDMQVAQFQSDLSKKYQALGYQHTLLAGFDASQEKKDVFSQLGGSEGGVTLTKPTTTVGTPSNGVGVDEAARRFRLGNDYTSMGWGVYAQNMVQLTPYWKLLGGLRYDNLTGDYYTYAANGSSTAYRMKISEVSKRAGVLYQPNDLHSYHFSAATSFNSSGDAYSLGAANANTPPEKSINLELGAKLDSTDKRFTTRLALFRATKLNERNTDPLLTVPAPTTANPNATTPVITLSGKRHVAGFELDFAGRITPRWEIYTSYMWIPVASVDEAAPCPATGSCTQNTVGEREGDRPSLIPIHSGTFWNTYQINAEWRVGMGINFRGKQKPIRSSFNAPSYVTADAMVEYKWNGDDRYTFKLNVNNLSNKLYADSLYPGHYVPGMGRLVQLTTSIKF
jgi:catecholate siderophore receptor